MKKRSLRNFIIEANNASSTSSSESKETFAIQVGKRLKTARKYTQSLTNNNLIDMAKLLDIDKTVICHYEAGRRIPSLIDFKKMCERYHVDPIDILGVKYKNGKTIHNTLRQNETVEKENQSIITSKEDFVPNY